jgi:hypothetical protein
MLHPNDLQHPNHGSRVFHDILQGVPSTTFDEEMDVDESVGLLASFRLFCQRYSSRMGWKMSRARTGSAKAMTLWRTLPGMR